MGTRTAGVVHAQVRGGIHPLHGAPDTITVVTEDRLNGVVVKLSVLRRNVDNSATESSVRGAYSYTPIFMSLPYSPENTPHDY